MGKLKELSDWLSLLQLFQIKLELSSHINCANQFDLHSFCGVNVGADTFLTQIKPKKRMVRGECESADTFDVGLTYNAPITIDVAADEAGGIGG